MQARPSLQRRLETFDHDFGSASQGKLILYSIYDIRHQTRACQGVTFHTVAIARQFIERVHTATGLRVTVRLLNPVCQTGRQYPADFKDEHLLKWNYRPVPECT